LRSWCEEIDATSPGLQAKGYVFSRFGPWVPV